VVIVPSWPKIAKALVMTLSIADEMKPVGKFFFEKESNMAEKRRQIDDVSIFVMYSNFIILLNIVFAVLWQVFLFKFCT
jgi:hypothetical protein